MACNSLGIFAFRPARPGGGGRRASPAGGVVDMYLPAVAGSTISSDVTRFIIGSVSIGQLIYMTETGAIILKNRDIFGLSFPRLAAVFLLRTVISLAAALCFASLLF